MASSLSPSRKLGQAKIISTSPKQPVSGSPLARVGVGVKIETMLFQFWPESLTDTKSVEYAKKEVLGSSHPLYQFIRGGERALSFTAVFVRDINPSGFSFIGAKSKTETATVLGDKYSVDINAAMWALRRFMYPSYATGDLKAFPPEVLQLQMDNTAIGGFNNDGAVDIMNCIMARCDFHIEAWFPDGVPRYATADMEFWETIQSDPSEPANLRYVDRMKFAAAWNKFLERQGDITREQLPYSKF